MNTPRRRHARGPYRAHTTLSGCALYALIRALTHVGYSGREISRITGYSETAVRKIRMASAC